LVTEKPNPGGKVILSPLPSDNHDRLNISWSVEETESAVLAETAPSLRTKRRLSTAPS